MPAALAYWRANKLDRLMLGRPDARFGIVTVGKSYLDVRQALDELGIDDAEAERLGLAIYKVGMVWPLETEGATAFAAGKREILVIEEKRAADRAAAQGRAVQRCRPTAAPSSSARPTSAASSCSRPTAS